jgi:hypothetical protein
MGGSREVASTPTATRITFSAAGEIPASIRVKAKKATVIEINPSTPRRKGQGWLRVDPERRLLCLPSKAGLSAVERVKKFLCLLNMFSSLSGPAGSQVGSITIANAIYLFTIL